MCPGGWRASSWPRPRWAMSGDRRASSTTGSTPPPSWPPTGRWRTCGSCCSTGPCPTGPNPSASPGGGRPPGHPRATGRDPSGAGPSGAPLDVLRTAGLPPGGRARLAPDPGHRPPGAAVPGPQAVRRGPHHPHRHLPAPAGPAAGGPAPRPVLRRQLSVDAAGRGSAGCRRPGHRAVPDAHHRPRLQRLDLHRPGHHLHRGRPGRRCRRSHRRPVGPSPRRAPPAGPWTCWTPSAPRTAPRPGSARPCCAATGSWASATGSTRPTIPARSFCARWPRDLGGGLVDFAEQVERTAVDVLADLKPGRQLYTNVEFFAGVVMHTCGIPREMFTPTFASSRTIGWSTQVMEQAADNRLIRPAARYVGPPPAPAGPGPLSQKGEGSSEAIPGPRWALPRSTGGAAPGGDPPGRAGVPVGVAVAMTQTTSVPVAAPASLPPGVASAWWAVQSTSPQASPSPMRYRWFEIWWNVCSGRIGHRWTPPTGRGPERVLTGRWLVLGPQHHQLPIRREDAGEPRAVTFVGCRGVLGGEVAELLFDPPPLRRRHPPRAPGSSVTSGHPPRVPPARTARRRPTSRPTTEPDRR